MSQEFPGENRRVCRKSPLGGKCLCCPSFQGATLFIVTLSDRTVPKGSQEGAGRQSGFSAHFRTTLPLWKEVERQSPACCLALLCSSARPPPSRLIWRGHTILYFVKGVRLGGEIPPLNSCVRLGWPLNFPVPQFFHLYNRGDNHRTNLISLLGGADDVM